MGDHTFNTLFLCSDNAVRSIFCESLLRHWGGKHFRAYSAGSRPRATVHPLALEVLQQASLPTDDLRPKSWEDFRRSDAPPMDFIITVCDKLVEEIAPSRPREPVTAHWTMPDPTTVGGSEAERRRAMQTILDALEIRIKWFIGLPHDVLDGLSVQRKGLFDGEGSSARGAPGVTAHRQA